ncbi:FABP7 [Branchiostoma lanceolatum]|uniref:FABP7 protein n=1 Tax=Branchiostoma lanceolatum TaxID=7740 RepID=A0A8J9Z4R1_BRALA|nr:FABP7 [Branchiostoma lanceolatum]
MACRNGTTLRRPISQFTDTAPLFSLPLGAKFTSTTTPPSQPTPTDPPPFLHPTSSLRERPTSTPDFNRRGHRTASSVSLASYAEQTAFIMPADLSGTWKLDSSENFEEFMKKLEVNVALRKMGALAKPTTEITQTGDHFVVKTSTTFKNTVVEFDIGKEFDEKTADDKEVKIDVSRKMVQPETGRIGRLECR